MSVASIGFDIYAKDRGAEATFDRLGKKVDQTSGFFAKHKAAIIGGAAAAGAAIIGFGKSSVEAYVDAEKSQRVLEDAYKRFPALANVSIDALREQAQALQNTTKFDGDAVNAMQGTLAQYKLNGQQIQQLTPLILDYAQKTGRDLPEAASVVGKAMLGQGRALKDVGINFKDTGSAAGNFDQLMGGLRRQVGGFATQEGKSAEGQAAILANNFGDLQEEVGSKLLPVGQKLIGWLIQAVAWMQQNSAIVKPLAIGLGILAGVIGTIIGVVKIWRVVQVALNIVLAANPIGIVIVAIAALAAGVVWAYKNVGWFRNIVDTAFKAIAAVARWLWNSVFAPVLRFIINGFATLVGWVAGLLDALGNIPGFGWAKDAAAKLRGASEAARGLASNIRNIPDANVNVYVGLSGPGVTALRQSMARRNATVLYGRAGGGPVRAGVPYLVGENPDGTINRTSELFVPDSAGRILNAAQTRAVLASAGTPLGGAGGGGMATVNVYLDGRLVKTSLVRFERQNGNG